ncbi:MAG: thioredoxin domain-containing protein [Planctomycetes bacterium]|nr:thioredoxin domain-containing protein [Planctomycetota bacterium]
MIPWQDWTDDLLDRAWNERRPVLLFLVADWCRHCDDMEQQVLGDERVQRAVREGCIPVKVDRRRHPHLDALYNQGGWPSTVILDGHGRVLAASTYIDAPHLAALVSQAGAVCRGEARPDEIGPLRDARPVGLLGHDILPAVERSLLDDFDERHGGFGRGQKFPHPEALDFAILRHAERRNPRLLEVLEKTLSAMAAGPLHDDVDGGFFRCCERRDWSAPQTEKTLETNADLLRNYLEAGQVLQRQDLLRVGERTAAAMLRDFLDPVQHLFHSGLAPDDGYYTLPAAGRRTRRTPARSQRFLADGNARAVIALLKAGATLGRPEWTGTAVDVARTLLARLLRPGRGMHHAWDGQQRQLAGGLRDQVETARMLLALLQYTDDRRFLEPLEDLLDVLAARHVDERGELVDASERTRAGAARPLEQRLAHGAAAAEVLLRAALYLGRPALVELARAALECHVDDFRRAGYAMAAYGRAVALLLHPPLHVVVVGTSDDPRTRSLLAASSATYLPSRVVQRVDPDEAETLARLGVPARTRPTAYLFLAHDCAGRHIEPVTLRAGLQAANLRRLRT